MSNKAVGLNITAGRLQIVEVIDTPNGKEVVRALSRQFLNDEDLRQIIQEEFDIADVHEKVVVTNAPHDATLLRPLTVPFKEYKKIAQMIRYEVKPHIPFPIEETVVDFYDMENGGEGETNLIVTAIREDVLGRRLDILRKAGLHVQIMDVENFALFSAYRYADVFLPVGKSIIIDVGKERSLVDISDGEKLIFTRTIHKKKEYLQEIEMTLTSFLEKRKDVEIKNVVLASSVKEEELVRIQRQLQDYLGLPVKIFALGAKLHDRVQHLAEYGGVRSNAIPLGLALRGLETKRRGINFAGEGGIRKVRLRRLKKTLISTAFLGVLLCLVFVANIFGKLFITHRALVRYKTKTRQVFQKTLPQVKGVVDEEAQLQGALVELEKKLSVLARFGKDIPDALDVFRELSLRILPRLKVDIEELLIDSNTVTIHGMAASLDMVNGLKRELAGSLYFRDIKTELSKGGVAGKMVGFKLTLHLVARQRR